jgi:tRNA pseudouridine38-40 synthase
MQVRLLVAYDGTEFRGFAPNPGTRTVLGALTEAISTVTRVPFAPTGAGRTDAGVHGWGQVVSGELADHTDLADLVRRVNKLTGGEVVIRSATWAAPDFDARFSATSRTYRYHVWNDPVPHPLAARTSWHVGRPLELWAMQAAGDPLVGEHDFSSFCRAPKVPADRPAPSLVRRVRSVRWRRLGSTSMLRFEITASSYCHQMVRSIVGTMVDIGAGRRTPADMAEIVRARDRAAAPTVAPPHGLVLWEVGYDGARWDA